MTDDHPGLRLGRALMESHDANRREPSQALLDSLGLIIQSERIEMWLNTPHELLDGLTPRAVIQTGQERRIWAIMQEPRNL